MKRKLLSLVLALALAATATACGSTGSTNKASNESEDGSESESGDEATEEDTAAKSDDGSAETSDEELVIRVANFDYAAWNAAFVVAYGLGYFDDAFEENVTVELTNFLNGPAVNEAFLAGEVDIVNGIGDQPIITALSTGQNNYVLASATQEPAMGLIVSADSDINTIADLKGKKIQCSIGTSGHKIVLQYLAQAGLTADDVSLVNMQDDDAAKAGLATGELDAIFLTGLNYLNAEEQGIGVPIGEVESTIPLYTYIEGRGAFVEEHPHVVEEFLAAVQKGKEYTDQNPEEAYQIIADVTQYDYDYVKALVAECNYSLELTDDLIDNLYTTSQFLVDLELISTEVSEEEIKAHVSDILDNIDLK